MSQEIVDFPLDLIDDRHAFTKWANSLKKIDSVKLHEYVIKYAEIIEIRENKEKYAYIDSLPFVMQQEEKRALKIEDKRESDNTILDISVSTAKRKTAYILFNQILRGIEKLGGSVYLGYEKKMNTELVLNPVHWQIKLIELSERKMSNSTKLMQPAHGRVPSGILQLEIHCLGGKEKNLYTNKDESFSKQLAHIFEDIREQYIYYRDKHIEEQRQKEAAYQLRVQQEETKRLAEEAEKLKVEISEKRAELKEEVFQHKKEFEKILEINSYIAQLQKAYEESEHSESIDEYIKNLQEVYNLESFSEVLSGWNVKIESDEI
ncbi:hypothetical protein [Enterococcus faecalis]|uniref:hypothetical protein n=1 Tax=Enterococcus faecalis TaxID=1351 RepID=UPI0035CBE866